MTSPDAELQRLGEEIEELPQENEKDEYIH